MILPQISGARFRDVSQDWRAYAKIRRKERSVGMLENSGWQDERGQKRQR